ncbi:hypothetical protein [Treponema sp.]|uniref:hypothetical protein n=1 Tax=Treponema sp. TaxID=166 RepID=UPI00298E11F3|nr:hypothetical protein [Treponema sp.]MCR5612813.1 hypothetical protein [Treponema sp.]
MRYKSCLFLIIFCIIVCSCNNTYNNLQRAIENSDTKTFEILIRNSKHLSHENLISLAEHANTKIIRFELFKLLCENGLSVNTALKMYNGNSVSEKKLIYLAFEYNNKDFIEYLLQNNVDLVLPCGKYHDFLCCNLYHFDGLYFDKILMNVRDEEWNKIDYISVVDYFLMKKDYNSLGKLFQIKSLSSILESSEAFTVLIAKNYSEDLLKYLQKNINKMNFSNESECIYSAVMSGNYLSLKWLFDHGISSDTKLNWYEEQCSIDEYIYEYFHHVSGYSNEERIKIINNYLSVLKQYY